MMFTFVFIVMFESALPVSCPISVCFLFSPSPCTSSRFVSLDTHARVELLFTTPLLTSLVISLPLPPYLPLYLRRHSHFAAAILATPLAELTVDFDPA